MDWEKLIAEGKYIGGDGETQEGEDVFRGPIKEIKLDGEYVHIELEWCAKLRERQLPWRKHHITKTFFRTDMVTPRVDSDGRVVIHISYLGTTVLFPKGGSKLDPAKVEGLTAEEAGKGAT